jgi:acyl-CoA dehydrogenase
VTASGGASVRDDLLAGVRRVAAEVAAPAADDVDRAARFPHETINALKELKLLGALVPPAYGGLGASIADVAAMCELLGQHCANAAMVFAMHQIQVACVVHHGDDSEYFRAYMRELTDRQLLIASATTEVNVGGDVRTSICAVQRDGARFSLAKQAPVISYGAEADDILVTARSGPDAAPSDQVLVLARKSGTTLTQSGHWDTLGFRGTCSPGFLLEASGDATQIMTVPYADISARTMHPVSHILWSSLWVGLAAGAAAKARAFVRAEARKKPGTTPPGALRLAELVSTLQTMRANVHDVTAEYVRLVGDPEALSGMSFTIKANNLKIASSRLVVDIVGQAMLTCGIAGYRHDSKFSLARHLRDAYGAALMINNDRIYTANASLLLIAKDE